MVEESFTWQSAFIYIEVEVRQHLPETWVKDKFNVTEYLSVQLKKNPTLCNIIKFYWKHCKKKPKKNLTLEINVITRIMRIGRENWGIYIFGEA